MPIRKTSVPDVDASFGQSITVVPLDGSSNARIRWYGHRRSDSGHDFERQARRGNRFSFFTASSEDEGITAL
jgi:hypothetical protein